MTDDLFQETVDGLADVLDAERAALLQGKLDQVARLHDRKEGLLETLNTLDHRDHRMLGILKTKLETNQGLINAALEGTRSVMHRLAAIRQVRASLHTYDSFGQKKTVDVHIEGTLERRS